VDMNTRTGYIKSPDNTRFKDNKDFILKMLWGQAEETGLDEPGGEMALGGPSSSLFLPARLFTAVHGRTMSHKLKQGRLWLEKRKFSSRSVGALAQLDKALSNLV